MLIINQPAVIGTDEGKVRLEALIQNTDCAQDNKIWYEVDAQYGKFLCNELADAFLLAIIPLAVEQQQDIRIEANISPKLLYNTVHTLVPYYACFLNRKEISVTSISSQPVMFNAKAVITGCSLGVDSFSAILQHMEPECQKEYKLSHLALFNSGQIGNESQEQLNDSFIQACEKSAGFAAEVGLPLVTVNSNLVSLLSGTSLLVTQYFHFFTISCVLAVQKLVKSYIMASSYSAECIFMDHTDVSHSEGAVVPLLGNENTDIILADTFTSRVDKTKYICKSALTPKYIDVCWANQLYNTQGGRKYYLEGKKHRNCGWCDKCMRTILTLELLGCIDRYEDAFDLKKYRQYRKDFIVKVVANARYNVYYQEIYQLMLEKHMHIPFTAYVARLINVKDSKIILWLWQSYNSVKRKMISLHK